MEGFDKIYKRIDIQQIRSFLLYGVEDSETDIRDYENRIKEEDEPLYKRLESLFPDGQERDDFLNDITQALVIREQIYMEIGIKAGVRLILKLLSE